MCFETYLKRRVPEKHEIWWYWRVQISYDESIGEQNDELSEPHNACTCNHIRLPQLIFSLPLAVAANC